MQQDQKPRPFVLHDVFVSGNMGLHNEVNGVVMDWSVSLDLDIARAIYRDVPLVIQPWHLHQFQDLLRRLSSQVDVVKSMEKEGTSAEQEVSDLKEELDDAERALKKAQDEIDGLKDQIDFLEAEAKERGKEL